MTVKYTLRYNPEIHREILNSNFIDVIEEDKKTFTGLVTQYGQEIHKAVEPIGFHLSK